MQKRQPTSSDISDYTPFNFMNAALVLNRMQRLESAIVACCYAKWRKKPHSDMSRCHTAISGC